MQRGAISRSLCVESDKAGGQTFVELVRLMTLYFYQGEGWMQSKHYFAAAEVFDDINSNLEYYGQKKPLPPRVQISYSRLPVEKQR